MDGITPTRGEPCLWGKPTVFPACCETANHHNNTILAQQGCCILNSLLMRLRLTHCMARHFSILDSI